MLKYLKYLMNKKIIQKSGFFDPKYYLFKYEDVRKNDIDPIEHYLKFGVFEGRNPSKEFNTSDYLSLHKDVLDSGMNPLLHYSLYGKKEGRLTKKVLKKESLVKKKEFNKPIKLLESDDIAKTAIVIEFDNLEVLDYLKRYIVNIEKFIIYICDKRSEKIDFTLDDKLSFISYSSVNELYESLNNQNIEFVFNLDLTYEVEDPKEYYNYILQTMIGSKEVVHGIVNFMEEHKDISVVMPSLLNKDNNIRWKRVAKKNNTTNKAVVYRGNRFGDYFIEELVDDDFLINDFHLSKRKILNLQRDLNLLKDFRIFKETKYKTYFKYIAQNNIESHYHYLNYGYRYFVDSDLKHLLKKLGFYSDNFGENEYIYLILYGALKRLDGFDLVSQEYQYINVRMSTQEKHLIDWEKEISRTRKNNFVSIVIPLYGQSELTKNCIDSIFSTEAGFDFEIILVNNSQEKDDIEILDKYKENTSIKVIQNDENLNFALGCNQGFSRSIGEIVVFLNNDTTVTDNWLYELVKPLNDNNISCVQPKLLYPDNALQCMGVVFSGKSDIAYPIYQNLDISKECIEKERKFQAITAACLAIRAKDFALVKGFDTGFVNGQEDIDLCLRLNQMKNSMSLYNPKSTVYHYESKSKGRGKFVAQNRITFIQRWKDKTIADDKFYYNQDGYKVEKYISDNKEYKKLNIEVFTPILKKTSEYKELQHPKKNNIFLIDGVKNYDKNLKTVMVSTHVVSKVLYGGQRSFIDMVQAVDSAGYNVIVTLPSSINKSYIDILSRYCFKIYILNYSFWSQSGLNMQTVELMQSIMIKDNVAAVYVNTIVCKEPLYAAKNLNINRVIHVREIIDTDEALKKTIGISDSTKIIEEVKRDADVLVCNSKATLELFNSNKSYLVYNKVDTDSFSNINNFQRDKVKFGIISGNEPKKGIYDFVKLAKKFKNNSKAEFVIIGHHNKHTKKIEKDIKDENLTNLKLLGYYESSQKAILECDAVLSLSHVKESFGRTIAEAMAAKKPVIAYKYGAMPELIDDSINGFLCEHMNLEQVSLSVDKLIDNQELLINMGENGFKKINSISNTQKYNKDIKTIFEELNYTKPNEIDTTVIIPIYNAYDEVINCIDSVLASIDSFTEVLLINDCSPDKKIKPLLERYKGIDNLLIYNNEENMGYTRNINKAIKLSKGKDIVLLNSDTIVTKRWLESLKEGAYENDVIGTVTAMSDNAGAFSFPRNDLGNKVKPDQIMYDNYAELLTRYTSNHSFIEVPTGSGFCLYIKGKLLDNIGLFDEVSFPRGYGEENDFCLRAIDAGWKNIISTKSFVFHVRTASFKEEKKDLIKSAGKKILEKYPNYTKLIQEAFNSQEIKSLNDSASKILTKINKF